LLRGRSRVDEIVVAVGDAVEPGEEGAVLEPVELVIGEAPELDAADEVLTGVAAVLSERASSGARGGARSPCAT